MPRTSQPLAIKSSHGGQNRIRYIDQRLIQLTPLDWERPYAAVLDDVGSGLRIVALADGKALLLTQHGCGAQSEKPCYKYTLWDSTEAASEEAVELLLHQLLCTGHTCLEGVLDTIEILHDAFHTTGAGDELFHTAIATALEFARAS